MQNQPKTKLKNKMYFKAAIVWFVASIWNALKVPEVVPELFKKLLWFKQGSLMGQI